MKLGTILPFITLGAILIGAPCAPGFQPGLIETAGATVEERIRPPKGYERIPAAGGSFLEYLRGLPLKPHGSPVLYYNGEEKPARVHAAVIDQSISPRNLQQCADAIMRLRGEYLFGLKRYREIVFTLANGMRSAYTDRVGPDRSYGRFLWYMDHVFAYANTASMFHDTVPVPLEKIRPGDFFLQRGRPYGHAVLVMDVAENPRTGERVMLLAQSYMPAQETHVLINPLSSQSPWYSADIGPRLVTPEWEFLPGDLRRYRNDTP
ncbi:MAG: DUF4846 domain-containing protein [Spirochaetes bacterium]|nr:DUF4846 domain-containing protein [Spirochaetota bacterium]